MSFELCQNGGGDRPRKLQFSKFQKPRDLDLGSGRGHTGVHIWSRAIHIPNYIEIGITFCGRTDGWTYGLMDYGRTHLNSVSLLGHRLVIDLKK